MKRIILSFLASLFLSSGHFDKKATVQKLPDTLAEEVKNETLRTWDAYTKYAWPHDGLLPISKPYHDWYSESINMSPIDAYSNTSMDKGSIENRNGVMRRPYSKKTCFDEVTNQEVKRV